MTARFRKICCRSVDGRLLPQNFHMGSDLQTMTATAALDKTTPFKFDERILIHSSSTTALKSLLPSSSKTVRLESLAQWKDDAWIHPLKDIDLGLSSSSKEYGNKIARIRMGISSHSMQPFPASSDSLDNIPALPLWRDDQNDSERSASNIQSSARHLNLPPGFSLSIQPVHGLTLEEEARAVQSVFQELINIRLLATPVTDGKWDIVKHDENFMGDENISPRLYELILPFDGAAWSNDALAQSFRRTLPKICRDDVIKDKKYGNDRFFGWSALEWSNFLVGYMDGGGKLKQGDKQSLQHLTYNKIMWWTWTNQGSSNEQSLSFGIQYETTIPYNASDWLPNNFLEETSKCSIGNRNAFEVVPVAASNAYDSFELVPIAENNGEDTSNKNKNVIRPNLTYSVGIDQVLRRHHTNEGRFESSIKLNPLFELDGENTLSCQMKYRQVFPDFFNPTWRSLRIFDSSSDTTITTSPVYYSNSDRFRASVEWNPEDQSSILTVEATSDQNIGATSSSSTSVLPSTVFISLEYAPVFLTIDDFPGDPNRGRVLPPARVTVHCGTSTVPEGDSMTTVVYSNSLLLLPPVPDLSMPFNVISLTSSLYAYIIGAMVTILVRKGSEKVKYKMHPNKKPKSKLAILKDNLRQKIGRVKTKMFGKEDTRAKRIDESVPKTAIDKNNLRGK